MATFTSTTVHCARCHDHKFDPIAQAEYYRLVAVFAGVTMVSNVPFYSFKEFNWKRRVPLWAILAAVIGYSVIATQPSLILFVLFLSYALSGYVMWAMGRRVRPVLPEE